MCARADAATHRAGLCAHGGASPSSRPLAALPPAAPPPTARGRFPVCSPLPPSGPLQQGREFPLAAPALVRARCGHPHPCAVRTPPTAPRPARPRRPPPGAGPRPPRVRAPLSGARLQALLQCAAGRPRTAKPSCPSDAAPRRVLDRRTAHRRRLQPRRGPAAPSPSISVHCSFLRKSTHVSKTNFVAFFT